MARLARVVIPGLPHHVTQRGNGRARTFFDDVDYALYRDLLAQHCRVAGVAVWAWCLMPNHVHLILVPSDADGLRRALAAVHRRYAGTIHARRKRTGHFWQGRFGAVVMDENYGITVTVHLIDIRHQTQSLYCMARLARVVIPGLPHHVTQRGNGRARTFFDDADYALYRDLLAQHCRVAGVAVWAWCLMPNHVHLILVPSDADGLRRALAAVHRRYAGTIHARRKRSGHFWQGRFGAVVMDEEHLAAALAYVSLNPVRARLVERARDWRWSSTRAHLTGKDDGITARKPIKQRFPDFADLLAGAEQADAFARLRAAESIGRPLGDDRFLAHIERLTARRLRSGKRGPKPKHEDVKCTVTVIRNSVIP